MSRIPGLASPTYRPSNHSLNRALRLWYLAVPGRHGYGTGRWFNIARNKPNGSNYGTLTGYGTAIDAAWNNGRDPEHGWGSLEFDGTNDYIDSGAQPLDYVSGDTMSMCCWFKDTTNGEIVDRHYMIGGIPGAGNAGFEMNREDDLGSDLFRIIIGTGSLNQLETSISDWTQWAHYGATYDGITLRAYENGIEINNTPVSGNVASYAQNVFIGAHNEAGTAQLFHSGWIDDVRIWNRALSASEMKQVCDDSLQGYPLTLARREMAWLNSVAAGGGGVSDTGIYLPLIGVG